MRLLALITLLLATPVAAAAQGGPYGYVDPRIQMVEYDPDRVVLIRGSLGYQLMLEFASDERIENVSIGDSLGWQVTPNRRANVLFLKPIDSTSTNMTVLTSARRYVFDLAVAPKGSRTAAPYTIRFSYPQEAVAIPVVEEQEADVPPTVVNDAYTVTGSRENMPVRVFDDGRMTYFEWPAEGPVPAIFAVGADGSESVINYGVRGPYVVVEQLSGRFTLRDGKQVATVTNHRFATSAGSASK